MFEYLYERAAIVASNQKLLTITGTGGACQKRKKKIEIKIQLNCRRARSTIFRGFLAVRVWLNHAKAKILNNLAYLEWVRLFSGGVRLVRVQDCLSVSLHKGSTGWADDPSLRILLVFPAHGILIIFPFSSAAMVTSKQSHQYHQACIPSVGIFTFLLFMVLFYRV